MPYVGGADCNMLLQESLVFNITFIYYISQLGSH